MIPPEPGPDPPTPTPTYNDWEYLSTDGLDLYTVYVDVRSASDSFVGVVTVGLNTSPSWYSDGSLIHIGDKYYPCHLSNGQYYDYENNRLMQYSSKNLEWQPIAYNVSVFDQVPVDFISYLRTGNFTLVQG